MRRCGRNAKRCARKVKICERRCVRRGWGDINKPHCNRWLILWQICMRRCGRNAKRCARKGKICERRCVRRGWGNISKPHCHHLHHHFHLGQASGIYEPQAAYLR
jgi:hypothetical protein